MTSTAETKPITNALKVSIDMEIDAIMMIEATNVGGFRERQPHEETRAEAASKQAPSTATYRVCNRPLWEYTCVSYVFHRRLVLRCVCVCAGVCMYAFSYIIHMPYLLVQVRVHRCFMCVS